MLCVRPRACVFGAGVVVCACGLTCSLILPSEANAILLHKLEGEAILGEIIEAIAEDQYEYPIAFPYKLKLVLRAREPLLKKDEEAKKMVFPERDDGLAEIARFRDESLVKALVLKRPGNVIAQKKGQEAWKGGGVRIPALLGVPICVCLCARARVRVVCMCACAYVCVCTTCHFPSPPGCV